MTQLKLVQPAVEPEPEVALAELIPLLAQLERQTASTRSLVDHFRRLLADKRQLAFIRLESVKREFKK